MDLSKIKVKRKILLTLLAASAVFASGCISSDKSEETTKTSEIITETESATTSFTDAAAETVEQENPSFKWATGAPQEHGMDKKSLRNFMIC